MSASALAEPESPPSSVKVIENATCDAAAVAAGGRTESVD